MDTHTKKQRSFNMSQIKSENTLPEKMTFKYLRERNYKFKMHYKIYGKPDIAFPKDKIAIFIDGEFWHGKNFNAWKTELSEFWFKKISENIRRDKNNRKLLKKEGWKVLRIWGKEITKTPGKSFLKITDFIEANC